jgi:hypothetical protein
MCIPDRTISLIPNHGKILGFMVPGMPVEGHLWHLLVFETTWLRDDNLKKNWFCFSVFKCFRDNFMMQALSLA